MKHASRPNLLLGQSRLPPELIDMVIDHLYNDKVTLAQCTLVARSWLSAARMHLFRDITVFHERTPEAFGKFVSLLRSKLHLRVLIKTLCLNGYHPSDGRQGRLDATILESIVALLPALDTLLVVNCFWERDGRPSAHTPEPTHRVSLKNLYITYFSAEEESRHAKLEILRHFSKVDQLRLDHVWLGHFEIDDDQDGEVEGFRSTAANSVANDSARRLSSLQVTSLTLSLADICLNFLAFLWRQPFITTLTSLTVQDLFHAPYLVNHEDLTFVGEAIRDHFAPQLRYFELDLPRLREHGE
ncbi:hypothetical protein NM688_g3264 [Phlebia brevispora]|uniref:Uncharacterized protein n=1 Tax=Phlebia brevispora TaxID=194682 RepID=A0ACC1T6M4_9APHY|nr:hypothetical protein NM688_g3264 [Phlebia brevispora]